MPHLASPKTNAVRDRMSDIRSVKTYQSPHHPTSLFQAVTTIGGLLACYAVLFTGMSHHIHAVLLLLPLASGLAIRTFTLQHDCGHGSLFRSAAVNRLVGRLCSLLTLTPYDHWRRHHAIHHGDWNNIESRGRLSDIYSDCTTVSEYYNMSRSERLVYRISKNPFISILIMPPSSSLLSTAFHLTPLAAGRRNAGAFTRRISACCCSMVGLPISSDSGQLLCWHSAWFILLRS